MLPRHRKPQRDARFALAARRRKEPRSPIAGSENSASPRFKLMLLAARVSCLLCHKAPDGTKAQNVNFKTQVATQAARLRRYATRFTH